jgi:hypothetical protein
MAKQLETAVANLSSSARATRLAARCVRSNWTKLEMANRQLVATKNRTGSMPYEVSGKMDKMDKTAFREVRGVYTRADIATLAGRGATA